MGASFVDEIDCGSFFDQIDDLLDFPTEDLDVGGLTTTAATDTNLDFPAIWSSTDVESFPGSDSVFSGNNTNSDLSTELSVPYEDIVQLEWLSNFVEDSFSSRSLTLTINKQDSVFKNDDFISTTPSQFLSSSPVSVLDDNGSSSSSSSGEKTAAHCPEALVIGKCGRARSKRPRPTSFSPRSGIQLISPSPMMTSSITDTIQDVFIPCNFSSSDSENYAESRPPPVKEVVSEHKKMKKKKIKFSFPREMNYQNSNSSQGVRKCLHCEVTKTPQWRAGPLGPKTLCNACGVRFKSGRLFPEYRPAASPTFVPCLHSNSHKKVIEMRTKGDIRATNSSIESPELIPNTNSGISMEFA